MAFLSKIQTLSIRFARIKPFATYLQIATLTKSYSLHAAHFGAALADA
jgi:hypothetical protein